MNVSFLSLRLSAPRPLDLIACNGCGRCFATEDGPGMLAVIKGACPDCGGRFELLEADPEDPTG